MRQRKVRISGGHVVDEVMKNFADVFGLLSSSVQILETS